MCSKHKLKFKNRAYATYNFECEKCKAYFYILAGSFWWPYSVRRASGRFMSGPVHVQVHPTLSVSTISSLVSRDLMIPRQRGW